MKTILCIVALIFLIKGSLGLAILFFFLALLARK